MVFKELCILVLWTKVASALEGLKVVTRKKIQSLSGPYRHKCVHSKIPCPQPTNVNQNFDVEQVAMHCNKISFAITVINARINQLSN